MFKKRSKRTRLTAEKLCKKVNATFPQKENHKKYMDIILVVNEMLFQEHKTNIVMDTTDKILAKELVEEAINSIDILNNEKWENHEYVVYKIFFNILSALYLYDKKAWDDSMRTVCAWKLAVEILKNIKDECMEEKSFTRDNILEKISRIDKEKYLEAVYSENDVTSVITTMICKHSSTDVGTYNVNM